MQSFEAYLTEHGPALARALDAQRQPLCNLVSARLAATFPRLGYDANRPDPATFQQTVFQKTPIRMHTLLSRYDVQPQHMLALGRISFAAARELITFTPETGVSYDGLEAAVAQIIWRVTNEQNGIGSLSAPYGA